MRRWNDVEALRRRSGLSRMEMDEYNKLMGFYWKHPTYIRFEKTLEQMLKCKTRARALKQRDLENQFLIMMLKK